MKASLITVASEISASSETELKGKVQKKAGKRVGYNYIILKSYKQSQKNDVVKCLYIKSLTKFGFCVIKEGSYGDTKDKHGRDIIDRLKWQKQMHQVLQDKVRIPRLLGHFEERGNYYLIIEHIRGKALHKAFWEKRKELRPSLIDGGKLGIQFLDYLVQITDILEVLHGRQVVHRDATPNNYMITHNGKVAVIDVELCYSLEQQYPSPAFKLGTYGYMSPQQEATLTPTTAEDIFALGAIILQLWSGVSPGKIIINEPLDILRRKVSFFIPDKDVSEMVINCLLPEDSRRPQATQIRGVLQQYKTDLKYKVARTTNLPVLFTREEIMATVQEGIRTLATPLMADDEKGWFANELGPPPADDKHGLRKAWYASYNHGVSGIIYMLAQCKSIGLDTSACQPFIEKGLDLIKVKYVSRIERAFAGLHFGSDGIAAALASAIRNGLIEPNPEHLEWIDKLLEKAKDSVSNTRGVAGQGSANLASKSFISAAKLQERLQRYAELLISKQDQDGSWVIGHYRQKYTRLKKKRVTRGFAEGMSGVVCFLLEFGFGYQHTESINAARRGLQWLIKQARHKKNTVYWLSAKHKDLNYGWADGTAGIVLAFIKVYELTGESIYKKYAQKGLIGIPETILDNNIGQRTGLSGLGEIYLEAYRVFKENIWFERAGWIAQVIMHLKKEHHRHGTYWLVENERHPTGSFMSDNSGVIHFLLRYSNPDKIGFPL